MKKFLYGFLFGLAVAGLSVLIAGTYGGQPTLSDTERLAAIRGGFHPPEIVERIVETVVEVPKEVVITDTELYEQLGKIFFLRHSH